MQEAGITTCQEPNEHSYAIWPKYKPASGISLTIYYIPFVN